MMPMKDETGKRYGKLTVLSLSYVKQGGQAYWKCRCDCGEERIVTGHNLRSGTSKSCGCLSRDLRREKPEANPTWHGGKAVSTHGYMRVMVKGHSRADRGGYVPEHIVVMEKMIGGNIPGDMVVHHLNKDKLDNRPANLILMSKSDHVRMHRSEGKCN